MQITVRGHNVEVTDALKQYAVDKAEKIGKFFDNIQNTVVELNYSHTSSKDKRQIAQITSFIAGTVVRAEEASEDMYASIDMVIDKIERQLKKYNDKLHDRHKKGTGTDVSFLTAAAETDEFRPHIAKTKRFSRKPMTPWEAVLQMEMVHHDFFIFCNANTDSISVVYKRKDGNFGMLVPEE
ncbi:ribosome hibernation-promoting factor, HPF/YfiA family [Candidatus Margulisiibacteriota bacterium]